jgi:putative hemolysin
MAFEFTVILLLVLANGIFAGAEIAVVGLDRARLRSLLEDGRRGAKIVHSLRANPERLFATVQVVITVVGATAGAFGGATFARDLAPRLTPWLGEHADSVALVLSVSLISYLSLVVGELVPKSLALRHAERYALTIAPLLAFVTSAARPLVWFLTKSSNLVLGRFGDQTNFTETRLSPAELRMLVDEATESGSLEEGVGELAQRAFDFSELTVGEMMIPRMRVVGIPRNASNDELRAVVLEHAHSRLPVYDGTIDNIIGYLLYKDLIALAWERQLIVLEDLIRPAYFVSEAMPAPDLLYEMRERRVHLAIVVDEHGGTAGIVTLDELVEELVGEVVGEIHAAAPGWIRRQADGALLVRGDVPLRELKRSTDIELPEGETFTTIGGLAMFLAESVPQVGTLLTTEDGAQLLIEEASDRAVTLVRILPPKSAATEATPS